MLPIDLFSYWSPTFWLNFCYFWVAIGIAFYLPGSLVVSKFPIDRWSKLVLSLATGCALWMFQGYIFGVLSIRFMTYIYLGATVICAYIYFKPHNWKVPQKKLFIIDPKLLIFYFLCVLYQLFPVWSAAFINEQGLSFPFYNHVGQLAIVYQALHKVPPDFPGLDGIAMRNYHFFSHIAIADLIRIFHLPLLYTANQYMFVFISLLYGGTALSVARILHLGKKYQWWLLFFYFPTDISYILTLLMGNGVQFSLLYDNPMLLLNNLTTSLSYPLLFAGIAVLLLWMKRQTMATSITLIILLGVLVGVKIHTAIFAYIGILSLLVYHLWKRDLSKIFCLACVGVLALLLYVPTNQESGGLIYAGFWHLKAFVEHPAWGFPDSFLSFVTDVLQGNGKYAYMQVIPFIRIPQVAITYSGLLLLFLISYYGLRFLSVLQNIVSLKHFPMLLHLFFASSFMISLITGLFFQQAHGGGHTGVFLSEIYIVISFYAALTFSYWIKTLRPLLSKLFVTTLLVTSLIRVVHETNSYASLYDPSRAYTISWDELQALDILRNTQTTPNRLIVAPGNTLEETVSYVSFLSGHPVFFSAWKSAQEHGYEEVAARREIYTRIFSSAKEEEVIKALEENDIKYIYFSDGMIPPVFQNSSHFIKLFTNGTTSVLELL